MKSYIQIIILLCVIQIFPSSLMSADSKKKTSIFRYDSGLCTVTALYDVSKYSELELRGTLELILFGGWKTSTVVFDKGGLERLSVGKLDNEYVKKKEFLDSLQTVNVPFWKEFKQLRMKELEEQYKLRRIDVKAYTNPQILLLSDYGEDCLQYAKALNESDNSKVLAVWHELHEKQKLENLSPDRLEKEFQSQYHSKDSLIYAKLDLMESGWHNCANKKIVHVSITEETEKKFEELFESVVNRDCDEQ
jgi:hypothetical protein